MRRHTNCGAQLLLLLRSVSHLGSSQEGEAYGGSDSSMGHPGDVGGEDGGGSLAGAPSDQRRERRRLFRQADSRSATDKMIFQRDHSYSRRRPLLQVPWLQMKVKTYMDDAERLYGRKEQWPAKVAEDASNSNALEAVLRDYLTSLHEQTVLEEKRAKRFAEICHRQQEAFRSYVVAGLANPSVLRSFAQEVLAKSAKERANGHSPSESDVGREEGARALDEQGGVERQQDGDAKKTDTEDNELRKLERRLRGEQVREEELLQSEAFSGLHDGDGKMKEYSAFPFLRQRALSGKHTLDPSLVDWSAKYFPEDDAETFVEPPLPTSTRGGERPEAVGGDEEADGVARVKREEGTPRRRSETKRSSVKARNRLRLSLSDHLDRTRASFDAEGLFFRVDQQRLQNADDNASSAARPGRSVKPSEVLINPTHKRQNVVKVDWDTVAVSQRMKKTPEVHRARERLIRVTRGENPGTI